MLRLYAPDNLVLSGLGEAMKKKERAQVGRRNNRAVSPLWIYQSWTHYAVTTVWTPTIPPPPPHPALCGTFPFMKWKMGIHSISPFGLGLCLPRELIHKPYLSLIINKQSFPHF